jgi:SAM-dependent methyltransferase
MLRRACQWTGAQDQLVIKYSQADMECLRLPPDTYDLVFSGLALHYVDDLELVIREVKEALKAKGTFVFSVEHPIFTAPSTPKFQVDLDYTHTWPLNNYFAEGPRMVHWLGARVQKQHRTLGSYVRLLRSVGFEIIAVDEWGTTQDEGRKHPDWPNEGVIPRFLLISVRKE